MQGHRIERSIGGLGRSRGSLGQGRGGGRAWLVINEQYGTMVAIISPDNTLERLYGPLRGKTSLSIPPRLGRPGYKINPALVGRE